MTVALLIATAGGGPAAPPPVRSTGSVSPVSSPPVASSHVSSSPVSHTSPGPSATLPFRAGTVLDHLRGQLAAVEVRRQHVVARPAHAGRLRGTEGCTGDIDVHESSGVAEDLRWVARSAREARRAREPIAVLSADLLCHRTALSRLLGDSDAPSRALVGAGPAAAAPPVRVERQRVVSAGSPYHRVGEPNAWFLGGVRVGSDDAGMVAEAADRLASLADSEHLDDVPALLLVGLVRAGRQVSAVDVRGLHCRRVTDAAAAAVADAEMRTVDEDRVLLDSAVKADDGFFTTYCVSPYSKYIARWAARRGLTPNIVTAASLGIGVGAAACFAMGSRVGLVTGAVLLQAAFTADCVDGQLARYTRRFSALGGWLDAVFDRAKEYTVYAGLAVGAAASGVGSVWGLAVAALSLQTVRHLVDFCYAAAHSGAATLPVRPVEEPDDSLGARRTARGGDAEAGSPVAALSRWLEARSATRWLKKIVVLPIGERFALISLTAALFDARVTFSALLAWGGLAAAYTFAGRVLRALGDGTGQGPGTAAAAYRDDGPFAALAGAAGIAAGIAALIPRAVRSGSRALGWLVPPLLRAAEFAVLGVLGLAGGAPPALVFALLAAVAFHHYDAVYRVRQRMDPPPPWVDRAGLGWDGRMLAAALGVAGGAATPVYALLTVGLWLLFAGESVTNWLRGSAGQGAAIEVEVE